MRKEVVDVDDAGVHDDPALNVQIPKNQILELLRCRGDHDRAGQAKSELPDQADTSARSAGSGA